MASQMKESCFRKSSSCDSSSMSLIIGIEGLKERCFTNQKLIEQLQDENRRLLSNQQKYQNEIFKVSQDNEFLREKTDQLQEALQVRSEEVDNLRAKLDVSQKAFIDSRLSNDASSRGDGYESSDSDSSTYEEIFNKFLSQSRSEELKACLLVQQNLLKENIEKFQRTSEGNYFSPDAEIGVEIHRTCPMCEVGFPLENFDQEEFERHVLEHFQGSDDGDLETMTQDQFYFLEN